jgi:peptidoglycan/xylan/chitin deacetylase (PgdA/CDA1 family)
LSRWMNASSQPRIASTPIAPAHVVGSHSMTHPRLGQADRARVRAELRDSRFILEDVTGRACEAFRAPFFDPPRELGSLLEETGYRWRAARKRRLLRSTVPAAQVDGTAPRRMVPPLPLGTGRRRPRCRRHVRPAERLAPRVRPFRNRESCCRRGACGAGGGTQGRPGRGVRSSSAAVRSAASVMLFG